MQHKLIYFIFKEIYDQTLRVSERHTASDGALYLLGMTSFGCKQVLFIDFCIFYIIYFIHDYPLHSNIF
jgi:hypothetical protein